VTVRHDFRTKIFSFQVKLKVSEEDMGGRFASVIWPSQRRFRIFSREIIQSFKGRCSVRSSVFISRRRRWPGVGGVHGSVA